MKYSEWALSKGQGRGMQDNVAEFPPGVLCTWG
jgi:hypothetical protein